MVLKQSQIVKPTPTKITVQEDQDQDQAELTVVASLQAVKHLVETSLGCLTYLRGIFPDDHFIDEYVPGGRVTQSSSEKARRNGSIKVKKLCRGHSSEGDRFLDYWEEGVQDALDHEYLSSLIVAVYLDQNEPENLVESYTFNFTYSQLAGSKKKTVSMDVEEQMRGITLFDGKKEPVHPTKRDVRSSTQSIIRSLITLTQCLPELPRKRFITLKLFYNDDTPPDYEPPRFKPTTGHNFVFRSRLLTEGPDKVDIGPLETGHHGVSLSIASLTHLLPSAIQEEDEEELVPQGERLASEDRKAIDHDNQLKDATSRRVVWDAEEFGGNVGLSTDPEALDQILEERGEQFDAQEKDRRQRTGFMRGKGDPVGIISSNGTLRPIPRSAREEALEREKLRNQGEHVRDEDVQDVELFVARIVEKEWTSNPEADLARSITSNSMAQTVYDSRSLSVGPERSLAPSASPQRRTSQFQASQVARGYSHSKGNLDEELSIESQTQIESYLNNGFKANLPQESPDLIESFSTEQESGSQRTSPRKKASANHLPRLLIDPSYQKSSGKAGKGWVYEVIQDNFEGGQLERQEVRRKDDLDDEVMRRKSEKVGADEKLVITCDCGDLLEDGLMVQCEASECVESGSGWVHAACYGYTEKTIEGDSHVFCYNHELCPDEQLDSVRTSVLNKLASLTLMRRALHIVHRDGWPARLSNFAAKIGCDLRTATEVSSSLENEGYIVKVEKTKRVQSKSNKSQPSHSVLKHRQILKKMNETYFTPKEGAEEEILSLWTDAGGLLLSQQEAIKDGKGIDFGRQRTNEHPSSAQHSKEASTSGLLQNSQFYKSSQNNSTSPADAIEKSLKSRVQSELTDLEEEEAQVLFNPPNLVSSKENFSNLKISVESVENLGNGISDNQPDFQMVGHQEENAERLSRDRSSQQVNGKMSKESSQSKFKQSLRPVLSPSPVEKDLESSPTGRKRSRNQIVDEEMENGEKNESGDVAYKSRSSSYNLRARKRPTRNLKTSMAVGIELDDVEME